MNYLLVGEFIGFFPFISFRKVDREKKMKYQQQLDEIQERLTQRPLLFQRVSQEFMKQPGHSNEEQIVLEQEI